MNLDQVGIVEKGKIWYRNYGCFCMYPVRCGCYEIKEHTFSKLTKAASIHQEPSSSNSNDDNVCAIGAELLDKWILVKYEYDERVYPGKVTKVDENEQEVLVSVMRQKGHNAFMWPNTPDIALYSYEDVIIVIDEPQKASKRHYKLTQTHWQLYQEQL